MHFPGIESFDFYINFSKAKVNNLAILSYVLRNYMGNDIFLKKYFFTVIVKNGSCTLFGQTSHCAPLQSKTMGSYFTVWTKGATQLVEKLDSSLKDLGSNPSQSQDFFNYSLL